VPAVVLALILSALLPAWRDTVTVTVCQLVQAPVTGMLSVIDPPPLTVTLTGLAAVDPLANRIVSVTWPAEARLTDHCTNTPTALGVFTKPVPLNPAWLLSTVLPAEIVAFSASSRVVPPPVQVGSPAWTGTLIAFQAALTVAHWVEFAPNRLTAVLSEASRTLA
jgi:hypothetical protein